MSSGEMGEEAAGGSVSDGDVREYEFSDFRLVLQPQNELFPARLLKDGGEVAEFRKSSLACRLLFYLVKNRRKPVPTEVLMAALWPGEQGNDLQDPKGSLTSIIQRLRSVLDKNRPPSLH